MKIKSSYFLLAGVVGPILLSSPNIQANNAAVAPTASYVQKEAAARRDEQAKARSAIQDSRVAMQRVRGNCKVVQAAIAISDERAKDYPRARQAANGELLLIEGANVLSEGGRAVDGATGLELSDGFVCTAARSTGEVRGGRVTQVRNAAVNDFEEYDDLFSKQR